MFCSTTLRNQRGSKYELQEAKTRIKLLQKKVQLKEKEQGVVLVLSNKSKRKGVVGTFWQSF